MTLAPKGGFAVSLLTSAWPAAFGFMFGTVRSDSRARTLSTIWFDEPLIGRASKAITVSDGRVHSFSYTEKPFSPVSFMPFISPASRLNLASLKGSLRMRASWVLPVFATCA